MVVKSDLGVQVSVQTGLLSRFPFTSCTESKECMTEFKIRSMWVAPFYSWTLDLSRCLSFIMWWHRWV